MQLMCYFIWIYTCAYASRMLDIFSSSIGLYPRLVHIRRKKKLSSSEFRRMTLQSSCFCLSLLGVWLVTLGIWVSFYFRLCFQVRLRIQFWCWYNDVTITLMFWKLFRCDVFNLNEILLNWRRWLTPLHA